MIERRSAAAESQASTPRFVVIIPMFNAGPLIGENIDTLRRQTYTNFRCWIGDDLSTDDSVAVAERHVQGDPRFTLLRNQDKRFALGTAHALIEASRAEPEDVIVIIDGDDRLAHADVLRHLADTYAQHGCWVTYGSYSSDGKAPDPICRAYPGWVRRHNLFRRAKFRGAHLRSFKHALWRHIPKGQLTITQDELDAARKRALLRGNLRSWAHWRGIALSTLLDPLGRFPRKCCDKFLMLPLLELAGERSLFISEILYLYSYYEKELDYGKKTVHQKWYNRLIREALVHKPRLAPLSDLHAAPGHGRN